MRFFAGTPYDQPPKCDRCGAPEADCTCAPLPVARIAPAAQTIQQEVLDYFIVFGERHLNHLCAVFVDYYHRLRPHQGKVNKLLVAAPRRKRKPPPADIIPLTEFGCERHLGGLLTHYYRKAA